MTRERGDFQTPRDLARAVCVRLRERGARPASILEPTCGRGSFLLAARDVFPEAAVAQGFDIDESHVAFLRTEIAGRSDAARFDVNRADFFSTDWSVVIAALPSPVLVVGNPPWVTSAEIGALRGSNLPEKTNFPGYTGLDAVTGKSNFDISEWMMLRLLQALGDRRAILAMLCKTAVARRVLGHAWKSGARAGDFAIHRIDAPGHFGAAVDACLLTCETGRESGGSICHVFASLEDDRPRSTIGWRDDRLVADVAAYDRLNHLAGESPLRWRSGVKHDCAAVMEQRLRGGVWENGLGEMVEIENTYVHPLLKSSDLANGVFEPRRRMLVPQLAVGEDTTEIERRAPRTWRYLVEHAKRLDRRASSIYRGRPRFSVFGVGDYTFAPWKVAISGFYKRLKFAAVGPHEGRPIVFDDTVYFLPCDTRDEAVRFARLLGSDSARAFFEARVFWDSKRPITADLLRTLDLDALAAGGKGSSSRQRRTRARNLL